MVYYELSHTHEIIAGDERNVKILGIFSSEAKVKAMLAKYQKLPGFKDVLNIITDYTAYGDEPGFLIGTLEFDELAWKGGYFTYYYNIEEGTDTPGANLCLPYWLKDLAIDTDAQKILDNKYGKHNYPQGPSSELFQIKEWRKSHSTSHFTTNHNIEEHEQVPTNYVYMVQHLNRYKYNDDQKHIGIFSSLRQAQETVATYRTYNGFKDTPDGFFIDRYKIDQEYWQEGYYTIKI